MSFSGLSQSPLKLKVLTLNIWGKLSYSLLGKKIVHGSKLKETRIKKICEVFSSDNHPHSGNWDIIFLQEAWGKADRKRLQECSKKLYPYQMNQRSSSDLKEERNWQSGLLILSRYPIVAKEVFPFNNLFTIQERLSGMNINELVTSKAIYMAKVKVEDQFVWLFNTHLSANFSPDGKTHRYFREKQLKKLLERAQLKSQKNPVIFGGDLNFAINGDKSDLKLFSFIENHGSHFKRAPESASHPYDDIETYGGKTGNVFVHHSNEGQIDQLWSSKHFDVREGKVALSQKLWLESSKEFYNYSDHVGWKSTFFLEDKLSD